MNDFHNLTIQEPPVAVCEACGSKYFYQVQLHRYMANSYSAELGGELRVVEDNTPPNTF